MEKIFLIMILIILLIIFITLCKKKESGSTPPIPPKKYTIKDCISKDDLEFKIDTYQKSIEEEFRKNKKIIQEAKKKGYIKANIEWINRFEELNRVSYTLEKNLEYENNRKLNVSD